MTGSLGSTTVNRAVSELARRWSTPARSNDHPRDRSTRRRPWCARDAPVDRRPRLPDRSSSATWSNSGRSATWRSVAPARRRVAELTTLKIPSVLVPLPRAPGDHQMKNALVVVEAGGARLVLDAECSGAKLDDVLASMTTPETLAAMGAAAGHARTSRRGVVDRPGRRATWVAGRDVFAPGARVHVVGVGGAGHERSGASSSSSRGAVVSGSDLADSAHARGVARTRRDRRRRTRRGERGERRRRAVVAGRRRRQRRTGRGARGAARRSCRAPQVLAELGAGASRHRTDRHARQDHRHVDDGARDGRRRA